MDNEIRGLVPATSRLPCENNVEYGAVIPPYETLVAPFKVLKQGGNSMVLTAGILIASVVGAGIVSMGKAVSNLGWLLGSVVMIIMPLMNTHASLLLWRVQMGNPSVRTYGEFTSAAFARAPGWQRSLAEYVASTAQHLNLFFNLCVYSISIGRSVGTLFYDELHLCLPTLTCLGLLSCLPVLILSRSMGKYGFLMGLNVLVIMGSVLIPLSHMALAGTGVTRRVGSSVQAVEDITVSSTLSGIKALYFAYSLQTKIPDVISEMRNPAEFPQANMLAIPFVGIMYFIAGIGSYCFMGDHMSGVLLENLPFGPALRVSAACLLLSISMNYLQSEVVLCRWAHRTLDPKGIEDTSPRGWLGWATIVIGCLGLCWLVAQIFPFFTVMVDLVGATLVPLINYIIPILMYVRWMHDRGLLSRIGPFEAVLLVLEMSLSFLVLVFGSAFGVRTLVDQWGNLGAPFDCHCQNIWPTCACSPQHPGMEHCSAPKLG